MSHKHIHFPLSSSTNSTQSNFILYSRRFTGPRAVLTVWKILCISVKLLFLPLWSRGSLNISTQSWEVFLILLFAFLASSNYLIGLSQAWRPQNVIFIIFEDKEVPYGPLEAAMVNWKKVSIHPTERRAEEEILKVCV